MEKLEPLDDISNIDEKLNKLKKLNMYDDKINKIMNDIIPGLIRYVLRIETDRFFNIIYNNDFSDINDLHFPNKRSKILDENKIVNNVKIDIQNKIETFLGNTFDLFKSLYDLGNQTNKINLNKKFKKEMTKQNIGNIIDLEEKDNKEYEVIEIIGDKSVSNEGEGKSKLYLVKWADTWEPVENLENRKKLIKKYLSQKKKKKKKTK